MFNYPNSYGFINWENSLVGWWRAEGNADDESGNGNHGTFVGNATIISGRFGQAFSFDGNGDYVDLGDKEEFDFSNKDSFTVSVWVYKLDTTEDGILVKGDNNLRYMFSYRSYGVWQFEIYDGTISLSPSSIEASPQNKWVHLVGVYDSFNKNASLYVDSNFKSSVSNANLGDFTTAKTLKIGHFRYSTPVWNGSIDEVMIFNRALNSGEIKSLYDATAQNLITTFPDLEELTTYNYNIYVVNNSAEKIQSGPKTITVDMANTAPIVTLDSPLNQTRSSSSTQEFKCSATDTNADTALASAALHWDYGGAFGEEETIALNGEIDTAIFTKTGLINGTITWNCYVTDSNGNGAFAANNNTLIIGQTLYYVAPSGDDTNSGIIDQPFRTIQKCASNALPGDTCYVRAGTYRETITPATSGNTLANITFKAYSDEKVIISGADLLTGTWSLYQGGAIYNTTMNWDLGQGKNQIFVDGKMMMEARWPNTDDVMLPNFSNIDSGTEDGFTATINDTNLTQPAGFWDGAIVHAIWSPRYHAITGTVTSYSPGSLQIDLHSGTRGDINSNGIYYIAGGTYNALDNETEWFYDNTSSTLYLWAPGGVNPSILSIEAKKRDYAFDLNGKSYVNIEGFDIFASSITTNEASHHVTIDNINASYVSHYTLIDEGSMGGGEKGTRDQALFLMVIITSLKIVK
jgi:hypothetical protein